MKRWVLLNMAPVVRVERGWPCPTGWSEYCHEFALCRCHQNAELQPGWPRRYRMVPPDQGTHLSTLATANKPPLGDSHTPREGEGGVTSLVLPTPIRAGQLSTWLEGFHQADRGTLVRGFHVGFDVGYDGPHRVTRCANLKSALELPHIIDNKIKKELTLQRIAGPFASPPFPNLHISPLGVVPKKQHGSYRLIHHLSHPTGSSINDNIPQELCTVQYQTVENAIAHIRALGQGCFMAKTDIAEAFRIIPILPAQYQLFGLCWRDQYYYDKCLTMGCSSSCQSFECLSSALQWIAA